ncbi:glycoside hydrolase N-terminal domain-containing protein, partial [Brachybacterium alimentarium]
MHPSHDPAPTRRRMLGVAAALGAASATVPAAADPPAPDPVGPGATKAGTVTATAGDGSGEGNGWADAPDPASVLFLDAPATEWADGTLPIGNGRVGATFFGDPVRGVVQLNEISLWAGAIDYDNALNGDDDGDMDTSMTGFGTYLSGGRLLIDVLGADGSDEPVEGAELRRELDVATGLHTMT